MQVSSIKNGCAHEARTVQPLLGGHVQEVRGVAGSAVGVSQVAVAVVRVRFAHIVVQRRRVHK